DRPCVGPCEACDLLPNPGICTRLPGCAFDAGVDANAGTGGSHPDSSDARTPGSGGRETGGTPAQDAMIASGGSPTSDASPGTGGSTPTDAAGSGGSRG